MHAEEDHYSRIQAEQFFWRGLLLIKRNREEQVPDTNPLSTLQPKPKRFQSKKDLYKNSPPLSGTTINLSKPKKRYCFCSYKHSYKCITCCKLFNKQPSCSQYSQFPALQWVQVNLVPNSPLEDSSLTGRVCLALDNWKQIIADSWILDAIQGYTIEFWTHPIQPCPPAPLDAFSKGYTVNEHRDPQTLREGSDLSCRPTSITRVPVQSVLGPQKMALKGQ